MDNALEFRERKISVQTEFVIQLVYSEICRYIAHSNSNDMVFEIPFNLQGSLLGTEDMIALRARLIHRLSSSSPNGEGLFVRPFKSPCLLYINWTAKRLAAKQKFGLKGSTSKH